MLIYLKKFFALHMLRAMSVAGLALSLTSGGYTQEKAKKERPANLAMAPIEDVAGLPRVLLIGDSISIGYTLPVRAALEGKANVHRPSTNCGPTTNGLNSLDAWLGEKPWDVIHFNWGLHDLKYMGPQGANLADPNDPNDPKNHQQVPPEAYEANLRKLVARLKQTKAKLIWRNTTPIPQGSAGRVVDDAAKYNAIAAKIMKENNIPTQDLHAFVVPIQDEIMLPANVHFTKEGYDKLAREVANAITAAISNPYNNPPPVEPPYFRVRYEASSQSGELAFPVAYTVWIPPEVKTLRAVIVHQHGCGEGSCKSGQTGAFDLHWQALAREHDCALLSPAYEQPEGADCQLWCDPRHGSDARFRQALADLGLQSGHPEMSQVPWALWGHSGGGHWAGGMLMLHPDRIAAVWLRSGVPLFEKQDGRAIEPHVLNPLAIQVPVMCNLGTNEGFSGTEGKFGGVWPSNQAFFAKLRGAGGLVGLAVDPLTSHECGNQRYLAIPWFDACLSKRLPSSPNEPLRTIDPRQGWLAPLQSPGSNLTPPLAANEFNGELARSIWLPNQRIAQQWTQYVTDTAVSDDSPPPAPSDVQLKDNVLSWKSKADLQSGLSHFVIERDGVEIAKVEGPKHRFGRNLFQGLQYSDTPATPLVEMRYQLNNNQLAPASRFRVRAVNTVGGVSE